MNLKPPVLIDVALLRLARGNRSVYSF